MASYIWRINQCARCNSFHKKPRMHFRHTLRWLEVVLWIAGSCPLGYCGFTLVNASMVQARLARALQQSREAVRLSATAQASTKIATGHSAELPSPAKMSAAARLEIPRIGVSAMVLEGTGSRTLQVGLGHVPGTSWPGQPGNVAIAGHRDTFFRPLRRIEKNDVISLETTRRTYHYSVSSFEVVDPHDVEALNFHRQNELTLITCYPFAYIGRAPKRFVVHARVTD